MIETDKIEYTYVVNRVDKNYKVMEVVYTPADERCSELRVSVPMPTKHQKLSQVIEGYAPIPNWRYQIKEVVDVEEGYTGTGSFEVII